MPSTKPTARLFAPPRFPDEKLNRTLRDLAGLLNPLLGANQLAYMQGGGNIDVGARTLIYLGDGEDRLFLPSAAAFAILAGVLTVVNLGGGPIEIAAAGSDSTYDGHAYVITPSRTVQFVAAGAAGWTIVGDEIWASSSPDHWYENTCDYSTEPMRESTNTSPVLYTSELQFSWSGATFSWAITDEGQSYPGVAHGTCGVGATDTIALHTDTNAVRLRGRSRYVAWIKIPTLSTGTQRFIFRTGLANAVGTTPLHAVIFRYSDNLSSGNWECVTARSGSERVYDSGVAVVANTWYKLEWDLWVPDLICRWYISTQGTDGEIGPSVEVAVHNDAGLFLFPDDPMGVVPFDLQKTIGGTARSAKIHKHRFISELGPTVPSAE